MLFLFLWLVHFSFRFVFVNMLMGFLRFSGPHFRRKLVSKKSLLHERDRYGVQSSLQVNLLV